MQPQEHGLAFIVYGICTVDFGPKKKKRRGQAALYSVKRLEFEKRSKPKMLGPEQHRTILSVVVWMLRMISFVSC